MKAITRPVFGLLFCVLLLCMPQPGLAGLLNGGGSDQYAPASVKAGELAVVKLVVDLWGEGPPIKGRYTDLLLHYRLKGESGYKTAPPKSVPLPDNYRKATSDTLQYEAYEFTVPPYPKDTEGEIEFYFDVTLDGYYSKVGGIKTIKITATPRR